jgi:NosR/NirI family nitrous oxide reductase transcriptional regulator
LFTLQLTSASAAEAQLYEAPLPAQLFTAPDLCAHVPCAEVLPGAGTFSERKGNPAYVEAYKHTADEKNVVGYVFLSTDIVDMPGYSGKPIVTLIGMDSRGIITGAKILRHSESILRVGIPETKLSTFAGQYAGKFVGDRIEVGKPHDAKGVVGLDAISGATVTTVALHQVMLGSGIEIARQVGIIKPDIRPQATFIDIEKRLDWDAMVKEGSIQQLAIMQKDVGRDGDGNYIDLYFGYLNAPTVGKSVLGENGYNSLMPQLRPGEHAIFIIANGTESFKGSGFVRGGIYERIKVVQGMDTFAFRDLDYLNLHGIAAKDAPGYCESGIFIIRSDRFSGAYPWSLVFLANKIDKETGTRTFTSFDKTYWLPARYMEGGHPQVEAEQAATDWLKVWSEKRTIIISMILLAVLVLLFGMRDMLKERVRRINKGL